MRLGSYRPPGMGNPLEEGLRLFVDLFLPIFGLLPGMGNPLEEGLRPKFTSSSIVANDMPGMGNPLEEGLRLGTPLQ